MRVGTCDLVVGRLRSIEIAACIRNDAAES
jgi:hypothetical protein